MMSPFDAWSASRGTRSSAFRLEPVEVPQHPPPADDEVTGFAGALIMGMLRLPPCGRNARHATWPVSTSIRAAAS